MNKFVLLILVLLINLLFINNAYSFEIINIKSFDNEIIKGKLELPKSRSISSLVIFVPGSGLNTYENTREIGKTRFNYFDLFAKEINKREIAFFSYNTRGAQIGKEPPLFTELNIEKLKKNVPEAQTRDLETIIKNLRKLPFFTNNVKIILLGWSEGTIISSMAAQRKKEKINAIFLAGYVNENLLDILKWQHSGFSSMIFYKKYFDINSDNKISNEEFRLDTNKILPKIGDPKFENIDANKDGYLTSEDSKITVQDWSNKIFKSIKDNNDEWLINNYPVKSTSNRFKEHFKLEANKTRLLKLDLPIFIFHGEEDMNVPIEGVYDIKERFEMLNKNNLKTFVFKGHDHDLNYIEYPLKSEISEGLKTLFEEIYKFSKN